MNYKNLGNTDLKVSTICLGTMTWGEQNTEQEGFEQMDFSLDQGVNFWDTAELYSVPPKADTFGFTEVIIGNWFEKTKKREKVILATKVAGPAEDASLKDWEIMVDTNIKGVIYLTKAVLPGMIRRGHGQIINIGSVAGSWPYPGGNVYGSTKAFVQQFSRNLRSDLSGKNIRVSLVEPGMSETEFSLIRFEGDQEKAKAVYHSMNPLSADDIAETVFWICSMPSHVNVNQIELMPIAQAWAPFSVYRD